eukprot:184287-Lingulodinium_polyedra.AAC.1
MYGAKRFLALGRHTTLVDYPGRGVVVGDAFATSRIQTYTFGPLRVYCRRWPRVVLNVYVDDFSALTVASSEDA